MSRGRHRYPASDLDAVYRVIYERRDMRHFVQGAMDEATLQSLLEAANAAPSVGLSQPWRFVRITAHELRTRIHALVREEVQRTAEALGARQDEFLRLKVEGLRDCAELLVAAVADGGKAEIFGRRTLPEMSLASVACAIQNLWLAARAEGLGMGWVSMFEPDALARLLRMPTGVKPVALLCLGPVEAFYERPMLVQTHWRQPRPLDALVFENHWPGATPQ
ncbi:MAG: 5,6-dimethylbenzimidazole synthase [Panacagrimonas sp.]